MATWCVWTIATLTLALGIGANTALFSVVNGVLLNPLPYPHPDQVVSVDSTAADFGESSVSGLDWARDNNSFSSLAAYKSFISFKLMDQGAPERLSVVEVSSNFFPTLGVSPVLGRNFATAEDQLNGPRPSFSAAASRNPNLRPRRTSWARLWRSPPTADLRDAAPLPDFRFEEVSRAEFGVDGLAVRGAHAGEESGVCVRGGDYGGPGDWGKYRDFLDD